uniref:Ribosomal protein L24 n=1 Tax=Cryptomonas sp. CCAC 1634B TaxID=2051848 RepID=A0A679CBQ4_9CRYP|nr:ribosomal protein L24 [Cryptomonas sp. CCAC 1634B]
MGKKPVLHVKTGDTVRVISGRGKGVLGKVIKVLVQQRKVILQNFNLKKKHVKPRTESDFGRTFYFEAPISSSNVMLYSVEEGFAGRSSTQVCSDGTKLRVLKKKL